MKNFNWIILILSFSVFGSNMAESKSNSSRKQHKNDVQCWLTSPTSNILFQKQDTGLKFGPVAASGPVIEVNETQTFQTIDGFGNCLTDGSAELMH